MSTENKKICNCEFPILPDHLPSPADVYHGVGVCRKCNGVLNFPLKDRKVYSKDEKEALDKMVDKAISLEGLREVLERAALRNGGSLPAELVKEGLLLNIAETLSKKKGDK